MRTSPRLKQLGDFSSDGSLIEMTQTPMRHNIAISQQYRRNKPFDLPLTITKNDLCCFSSRMNAMSRTRSLLFGTSLKSAVQSVIPALGTGEPRTHGAGSAAFHRGADPTRSLSPALFPQLERGPALKAFNKFQESFSTTMLPR